MKGTAKYAFVGVDLAPLTSPTQIKLVRLLLEDKTTAEIAQHLGTSKGAVHVMAWAARKRLGIASGAIGPRSAGGLVGGAARAAALTRERRSEIARMGSTKRWGARSSINGQFANRSRLTDETDHGVSFDEFMAEVEPANALAPPPPAPPPPPPPLPAEPDEPPPPALAKLRRCDDGVAHRVIPARKLSGDEKRAAALTVYPSDIERPRTRGECENQERPCPWVSCAHHLYLDVDEKTGAIKLNFPHLEPWQIPESCALDVAARDGETLENVGRIMNLTRERVRQIEVKAVRQAGRKHPDRRT